MLTFTSNLQGMEETLAKFATLPKSVERGILRRALRLAARPVQDKSRQLAPILLHPRTGYVVGLLRRMIKIRAMVKLRKGMIGIKVGPRAGLFVGKAFYGGILNYGNFKTSPRRHKSGHSTGDVAAQYFMERAYDESKVTALTIAEDKIRREVENAWRS